MTSLWQLDNPEWVRRRKALWLANKDYFSLGQPRAEVNERKAFFLTGATESSKKKDETSRILDFYSVQGRHLALIPPCEEALFSALAEKVISKHLGGDRCQAIWSFLGHTFGDQIWHAQQTFAHEHGLMDGWERIATKILLPERYVHERHLAEVGEGFQRGRTMLSPLEAFNLMTTVGYGFLTHFAANPHHPIQEFIDYWLQTMPHFKLSDVPASIYGRLVTFGRRTNDARKAALAFCQAVRLFQEPRDFDNQNSPARQFRNQLIERLERGTGCAEFDAIWQQTDTKRGGALIKGAGSSLPAEKLLCGAHFQPSSLRQVHSAFAAHGGTLEAFDVAKIELVSLRDRVTYKLQELLGYARCENDRYIYSKGDIPAFHYRFRLAPLLFLTGPDGLEMDLHLLWLVPNVKFVPDTERQPCMVMFYSGREEIGHEFSVLDYLRLRELTWRLHAEHGLPFATTACGTQKAAWPTNAINIPHGCELYSNLGFDTSYIMDFPSDRKVVGKWQEDVVPLAPYKGSHPGADLARFKQDVMLPRS